MHFFIFSVLLLAGYQSKANDFKVETEYVEFHNVKIATDIEGKKVTVYLTVSTLVPIDPYGSSALNFCQKMGFQGVHYSNRSEFGRPSAIGRLDSDGNIFDISRPELFNDFYLANIRCVK